MILKDMVTMTLYRKPLLNQLVIHNRMLQSIYFFNIFTHVPWTCGRKSPLVKWNELVYCWSVQRISKTRCNTTSRVTMFNGPNSFLSTGDVRLRSWCKQIFVGSGWILAWAYARMKRCTQQAHTDFPFRQCTCRHHSVWSTWFVRRRHVEWDRAHTGPLA